MAYHACCIRCHCMPAQHIRQSSAAMTTAAHRHRRRRCAANKPRNEMRLTSRFIEHPRSIDLQRACESSMTWQTSSPSAPAWRQRIAARAVCIYGWSLLNNNVPMHRRHDSCHHDHHDDPESTYDARRTHTCKRHQRTRFDVPLPSLVAA